MQKSTVSRMCMIMENLTRAGVSIIETLRIAQTVTTNLVFAYAIERISKKIVAGQTLSELLKNETHVFPLALSQLTGTIHIVKNKSANKFTNTSFYNSPFLPKKHNHVELIFENFKIIYNDPRRFGFFQLIKNNTDLVKRFSHLGQPNVD